MSYNDSNLSKKKSIIIDSMTGVIRGLVGFSFKNCLHQGALISFNEKCWQDKSAAPVVAVV